MKTCPHATLRPSLSTLPEAMQDLPLDERGYPVPFFVCTVDGKPDFRVTDVRNQRTCIAKRLCWVCGKPLDEVMTFVIGPMCAINRISAEPPSHFDCAEFSAKSCPFLSLPKASRREAGMSEERGPMPGVAIMRNPGVTLLWSTLTFELFDAGGLMFRLGDPVAVNWFSQGRVATRAEVEESIRTGLPTLEDLAFQEGPGAIKALCDAYNKAQALLPRSEVPL